MKGPLIAAVVAFLVFGAAGTGVGMMRNKAHIAADSTHAADSTDAGHGAPSESAADATLVPHGDPAPDSLAVSPVGAADAHAATTPALSPMPPELQVAAGAADSAELRSGRIAKLFAAMSQREAAKVLQQMQDHDVLAILGALPEKRAGEILALMPPERSATIAKAMLMTTGASR